MHSWLYKRKREERITMKENPILEAALAERQEYLEDLMNSYKLIQQQIAILEHDIDELLFKRMEQSN